MKVLIENATPMNNGDAALIFALGDKLKQEGFDVSYSTRHHSAVVEKYPEETWIDSFLNIRLVRAPFIGFIILFLLILFSPRYRKYDAIISAPGGYIHSYYGFHRQVQIVTLVKRILRKKVFMYSQSIGELSEEDKQFLQKQIKYYDLFYVRDDVSMRRIQELGSYPNVRQTKDAAFLLDPVTGLQQEKTVAISVREWSFEGRTENDYISLISNLVTAFVSEGYRIVFLSTCQGDARYRDDSVMAKKIVGSLPSLLKTSVTVDDRYYSLNDLRDELTRYQFVIGTRLHMCILSWLSHTPAINISYEEKGIEAYNYLGIPHYSVDYNYTGPVDEIIHHFISDDHNSVFARVSEIYEENKQHLDEVIRKITS